MPVCKVLVELAITCVHDYMVVTVTVTKIYGKISFSRWALAITAVLTIRTSRFPTTGYARVLLFIMYKARARRKGVQDVYFSLHTVKTLDYSATTILWPCLHFLVCIH